jgi:hypothetical protein
MWIQTVCMYIADVLSAYTCQVFTWVILLVSDQSCRYSFAELTHMDIFQVHVMKMEEIFRIFINQVTFHAKY